MAPADPFIRIVYSSRSSAAAEQRLSQDRAIQDRAQRFNAQHGISGMLMAANGHYLQLLEGPRSVVRALYARIHADTRHREVATLCDVPVTAPLFPDWAMGLMERSEPEHATAERMRLLSDRLAVDPAVGATDFFRLMAAPGFLPQRAGRALHTGVVSGVAVVSPSGLWSAAVLQQVAAQADVRIGRTQVTDAYDPLNRTLLEYIDVDVAGIGAVRALSLTRDPASYRPVAPLLDKVSLLVFVLGSSDLDAFEAQLAGWLAMAPLSELRPRVLVLTGRAGDRIGPLVHQLAAATGADITAQVVKISDASAVWRAACRWMRPAAGAAESPFAPSAADLSADDLSASDPALTALQSSGCLDNLMAIDGALQAAVLGTEPSAVWLSSADGPGLNAGSLMLEAEFLAAKHQLLQRLGLGDEAEEITVTTGLRLKIFRRLRSRRLGFLALTLDRANASLAMARLKVQEIEAALDLPD